VRINIYYGGRGLIEDPTIYVLSRLTNVLEELRVDVVRYNIYEEKKVTLLPNTLKEADAVILATTVEWIGIGGKMQEFLDACWFYGDKEKLKGMRMLPVVTSTTYGERDAECTLVKSWELLGGVPCDGICAYVENHVEFETDPGYAFVIEKKAEELYRQVSHKLKNFPTSINKVTESIQGKSIDLTPQESEQLSIYVSDDTYVKKQKEDIQELAQLFKGMLGEEDDSNSEGEFIGELKSHFKGENGVTAHYCLNFVDDGSCLHVKIASEQLECYYDSSTDAEVYVKLTKAIMHTVITGDNSLQRAFMAGEITAKGDFKVLRNFDKLFQF